MKSRILFRVILGLTSLSAVTGVGARAHEAEVPSSSRVRVCPDTPSRIVTKLKTDVYRYLGACELKPLRLELVEQAYPKMGGLKLTVHAWSGGYERPALVRNIYRTTDYDCGEVIRTSEAQDGVHQEKVLFPIRNPNLDESVQYSYIAQAPLTDREAAQALKESLKSCESAQTEAN